MSRSLPTPNTPYQDTRDCRCYRVKSAGLGVITLARVRNPGVKVVTPKMLKRHFVRLPEKK